jgi:hypothetical protein
MADPRHYSISILENFSDKPLQEIVLAVARKIEKEISEDDFTLWDEAQGLELGTNFLTTEEAYTWYSVAEDLALVFADFPDTCFCLSVSDGEAGGQYRILFFNGKWVKQYPEIHYEDFRPNDFEYQVSAKKSFLDERITKIAEMIESGVTSPFDQAVDALVKKSLSINQDNLAEVIAEMDRRIEKAFGHCRKEVTITATDVPNNLKSGKWKKL